MNLHRNRYALAIVFLALFTLAGCGKTKTDKTGGPKSPNGKSGDKSKSPVVAKHPRTNKKQTLTLKAHTPPKNITLSRVTPKELDAFIAKHKGQVVLVDYWATWCLSCKKAFPHTLELAEHYAENGLVVVSMCVDENENLKVADGFLKKNKAYIYNLYSSDKLDPDKQYSEFGIENSLPEYRVYGPDGKLAAKLTGADAADTANVDAAVEKALGFE